MSYIGNTVENQNYVPAVDYFNGDGSTVEFTLSRPVASVAAVQVVISNVPQNPGSAYTISNNTITFTSAPPSGTNNIYVYYTSPNTSVATLAQDPVITGNLNMGSTGARITGDFSNATLANRVAFKTSTTNGNTVLTVIPNGTSTTSSFQVYNNSDPTNAGGLQLYSYSTETRLSSGITGTGTYLPMTFYTGGSESLRLSKDSKAVILAGGNTSANGTGITFPATQSASSNANTLDDYEEGTYTCTVTRNGGTFTVTGYYTKVGRLVNAYASIPYDASTGTGNSLQAASLPFTNNAGTTAAVTAGLMYNMTSSNGSTIYAGFVAPSGGAQVNLYLSQYNTTEGYLRFNGGGAYFSFNATYLT